VDVFWGPPQLPMPPLDFATLMKEERAQLRAAARSSNVAAEQPMPAQLPPLAPVLATTTREPAWSYRLSKVARPALDEVSGAPATVWHCRDFVSRDEEAQIMRCVDTAPSAMWVTLRGRQLQQHGGTPMPPPEGMVPEQLPEWVQGVCDALVAAGIFPADAPPNHVLVNSYQPGQGIDAHKDGPLYAPRVAILSLGSVASFDFVSDDTERSALASLLLPPRGLLVFEHDAYEKHLHTVPAAMSDEGRPRLLRLDLAEEQLARSRRPVVDPMTPLTCQPSDMPSKPMSSVDRAASAALALSPAALSAALPPMPSPTSPPQPPPLPRRGRRISLTVRRVLHVAEQPISPVCNRQNGPRPANAAAPGIANEAEGRGRFADVR